MGEIGEWSGRTDCPRAGEMLRKRHFYLTAHTPASGLGRFRLAVWRGGCEK